MKRFTIAVALLLGLTAPTAQADLIYDLVAGQSSYSVEVGQTVDVEIFLRETSTGGDSSQLLGPDGGLLTAGVRLVFGDTAAAQVLSTSDIFENPGFTSALTLLKEVASGSAGLAEDVDFFDPAVTGIQADPGIVLLSLGVFRFTALSAGLTTVTVEDFDPDQGNFLTAGFAILDEPPSEVSSSQFTINATSTGVVPEPSSLALAVSGLAGVFALRRARRRSA